MQSLNERILTFILLDYSVCLNSICILSLSFSPIPILYTTQSHYRNNQINPEYQERLIEDEEEEKDLNSGKLLCDNCIGDLIDMVFFGPMIRPLFDLKNFKDAEEAGEKIKTGLLEFVAASGVVSALLVGIAIGQAFGSEATVSLKINDMYLHGIVRFLGVFNSIII